MKQKIFIDAGHGGYDQGSSYGNRFEKNDNLKLAMEVGRLLEKRGYDIGYTRTTDVYQSPNEKAHIANDNHADLFISLHRNASPVPNTYKGVDIYIFNRGDLKEPMANNILDNMNEIGFQNLGIDVRKNLAVLRRTKMPALLINIGFINTDSDNQLYDKEFNDIADGIASGIDDTMSANEEQPTELYYQIQVGLFRNEDNANNLQKLLLEDGYPAAVVPMGGLFAVLVGKYGTPEAAQKEAEKLENDGYETFVIRLE